MPYSSCLAAGPPHVRHAAARAAATEPRLPPPRRGPAPLQNRTQDYGLKGENETPEQLMATFGRWD